MEKIVKISKENRMTDQKVAVVTGGARGIGKAICDAFREKGFIVCTIDLLDNDYYIGDIADEKTLVDFSEKVLSEYGKIDYLINNACLSKGGLFECSYEDFNYVLESLDRMARMGVASEKEAASLALNFNAQVNDMINTLAPKITEQGE